MLTKLIEYNKLNLTKKLRKIYTRYLTLFKKLLLFLKRDQDKIENNFKLNILNNKLYRKSITLNYINKKYIKKLK